MKKLFSLLRAAGLLAWLFGSPSHCSAESAASQLRAVRDFDVDAQDVEDARRDVESNPPQIDHNDSGMELAPGEMDAVRKDLDQNPPDVKSVTADLNLDRGEMDAVREDLEKNPPRTDVDASEMRIYPEEWRAVTNDVNRPISGADLDVRDLSLHPGEFEAVNREMDRAQAQTQRDARNNEDLNVDFNENGVQIRNPKCEFGVRVGKWIPLNTQNVSLGSTVPQMYYGSYQGLPAWIWFNGLYFPLPKTVVKSQLNSTTEVEVEGFGQIFPHVSLGLEWGLAVEHDDKIVDSGYYGTAPEWVSVLASQGYHINPVFSLEYRSYTVHVTPELRLSDEKGPFKIYGQAGLGWYNLTQKLEAEVLAAPLFGFNASAAAGESSSDYLGANFGGGLEYRFVENLTIGVDLRYHEIFVSGGDMRALAPTGFLSFVF